MAKLSADAYIDRHSTEVGVILAELAESAGKANGAWLLAVEAARRGDLDHAETKIIEADIALDISVRVCRQDSRRIMQKALQLLARDLPDDETDEGPKRSAPGMT